MQFEWDERKGRSNRLKHGVSFETATLAFDDPHAVSMLDQVVDGEERWHILGKAANVVLLLVAFTYRNDRGEERIRIISARRATPREREFYEKAN